MINTALFSPFDQEKQNIDKGKEEKKTCDYGSHFFHMLFFSSRYYNRIIPVNIRYIQNLKIAFCC